MKYDQEMRKLFLDVKRGKSVNKRLKELGDCLWYINKMVADLGYTLEDAAIINLEKCYKRRADNTLHGNGDNR